VPEKYSTEFSANPKFGDLSSNIGMSVAAEAKSKNADQKVVPREIAQALAVKLTEVDSRQQKIFIKIEVAGPGFINFFISEHILSDEVSQLSAKKRLNYRAKK
jgi:arginyl-tRNA synthetase